MIRPTPKPKAQRNGLNKNGRRSNDWRKVWAWLKPRMEKAGRTSCEFKTIIPHECWGPLDPCHSKKRPKMQGDDIYMVARGCRSIHDRLDLKMSHEEMEAAVMQAIQLAGGPILPEKKEGK